MVAAGAGFDPVNMLQAVCDRTSVQTPPASPSIAIRTLGPGAAFVWRKVKRQRPDEDVESGVQPDSGR